MRFMVACILMFGGMFIGIWIAVQPCLANGASAAITTLAVVVGGLIGAFVGLLVASLAVGKPYG